MCLIYGLVGGLKMKRFLVLVSLAVLAACGDDDDKASCPYKVAVYELTAFEKNEMMCEAGGDDVLSAAQGAGQSFHRDVACSLDRCFIQSTRVAMKRLAKDL